MDLLTIPDRLYGRDREIAALLESFERVSHGSGLVLLVPGHPGVGKTSLVHELARPVRDRNGLFIQGKFDQYQQHVPYFAFRQALADLCRQLQSGDAQQRQRFSTDILEAVGSLGQLLVELAPEFALLLGPPPPVADISPQEARHRFTAVFRSFLRAICRPDHPLVLSLDDWQWADAASLELLRQMQVGSTLRYLLVVVSYRDDEVRPSHPLVSAVQDLERQAVPVDRLPVTNISVDDVRMLLADSLKPVAQDPGGLAVLIHAKTLGNPFFLRSFLVLLCELHLVRFDEAGRRWEWRLDEIREADLPDDVVALFVLKLGLLDVERRTLLALAACLGNSFDLETLGIISGLAPARCWALLRSAPARDMLLPQKDDAPADAPGVPAECRFLHDSVQQAAYKLIDPAELPRLLLKIGRLLLASLRPEQLAERLFEVVGDLNAGYLLLEEPAEQVMVVRLNITAARRAYAATAYRAALELYRVASRFLEEPGFAGLLWRDHHELAMRLHQERAVCEFLEGDRQWAEDCVREAVARAATSIEKADALAVLIVQQTLQARYPEAIAVGRLALETLGISLPEEGYEEASKTEIAQVRQALGDRPVSSLADLPVMTDPEMLTASRILITLGPPCYRSHQRLWSVIVPMVVNLTLRYGNIPQVGYSHPAFGGLVGWVEDDYATAKAFGEVATHLMTHTFPFPTDQSVFYLMIGSSIRHWTSHLRHATQDYKDAYEIGVRAGNLQYAAYAFGHDMYCRFYQATPLAGLIQETQRSLDFSRTRLNRWAIDLLQGGLRVFGALTDDSPASERHDTLSEEEYLWRVAEHENIQVTCIYKVLQTFSFLLLGEYDRAKALSDEVEPLIYTVGTQGLLPWPEHVFARLLILTALYPAADGEQQARWRPELDRIMTRLRAWADTSP
ncbi:MAG: AAA family ATPase, partial [Chloroflexota bacterium]